MTDYKIIVPNAKNGDPKALNELYSATSRAVYFTCLSLVKNEQDAEDLSQNTYIIAFKKLDTLAQPEKFEPWIKRIAVNLCKDFLIKKGTHPTQPLDEEGSGEIVDENILPDEYITISEKRDIVMKIIRENLSDALYQTVIMFYFDEMSIAEIAEEMSCPEGTVKYRLNAARAKIKKGVLDYEKENNDKLYAFAGLPFLARLLLEESKNTAIPKLDISAILPENSPSVPENAASQSSAANTISRGGLKMLNTLKGKIIAAVTAVAVVGGGTTAAVILANNRNDGDNISRTESSSKNSSAENPGNSGNSELGGASDPNDGTNSSAPGQNDSPFWFPKQVWSEAPRKEFEGGWLLDNRKTIDPEQLDNICAPYYNPLMHTAGNIAGSFAAALLAEGDVSDYDYADITTQYVGYGEPLPEFSGVELIRVFNFDNISHSLYDCYENGWWKLAAGENYGNLPETTALGLDASLRDPNTTPNESALLDAIIKKFGTPHFVRYVGRDPSTDPNADRKQALLDDMAQAADPSTTKPMAMSYALVYDYGDIIMTISVWEQRHSSGSFSTSVDYVEFWSPECWENRADVIDMDSDWDEFSLFTVYEP